ncbi:MAG: T9SS type A sorting domain-containing protein [Bacteroidetes bacterium]|nr:T9SS type A sorting domain-containing protein [Bacteroidota bacterium]
MRYSIQLCSIILMFAFRLSAQTILTEPFDYPVRDSLDGMGGWTSQKVIKSKVAIVAPGLSFTGYAAGGTANAVRFANVDNGDLCWKTFTKIDSGNVYLSFLLRVDSLTPSAVYGYNIALDEAGGSTNVNLRATVGRQTDSTFLFGISKNSGVVFGKTVRKVKQTYLIVLRYQFVAGASNDTARMYVFTAPMPASEPAKTDTLTGAGSDAASIGEIWLSNSFAQSGLKGSRVTLDEVRLGRTWESLTVQQGSTLMTEDFYFNAGDTLRGKNGWIVYYEGTPVPVDSTGLSFTGYHGSGMGRSIRLVGGSGGQTLVKTFPYTTDSTFFLSCMVNVAGSSAADGFFISMTNDPGGSYRVPVYAKITAGKLQFGIRATLSGPIVYDTTGYVPGVTYVLLVRYRIVPGASNDEASLFVFGGAIPASEPPRTSVGPLIMPNDNINVMGVALNTGAFQAGSGLNGATIRVDGIRITTLPWRSGLTAAPVRRNNTVPEQLTLDQNYPNPFNPSTSIRFSITAKAASSLRVFDMVGREVGVLVDGMLEPGEYSVRFDGSGLASGIYLARLQSGHAVEVRKMMLLK